ncbi:MAG: zf-HC2 domain-containing protein [Polyangia bacterium]
MSVRDIVQLSCKEVVELVTDYQENALAVADRVTFEQHLFGCTWCMTYLQQVNRGVELTTQLREPSEPGPIDTQKLATLFRKWQSSK